MDPDHSPQPHGYQRVGPLPNNYDNDHPPQLPSHGHYAGHLTAVTSQMDIHLGGEYLSCTTDDAENGTRA